MRAHAWGSPRWNQELTERLWALIKSKPELKRVLVNEPTRFLGPHGAATQLFSKKDLQRTIAEHLFSDGMYDLSDQAVMDNLTRAVKNKLHKWVNEWRQAGAGFLWLMLCSPQNPNALRSFSTRSTDRIHSLSIRIGHTLAAAR
jgi:hypothetical protein